jgi:predicted ATP-grasp superfamily ATP-dependent carboligase
MSPLAPVVVVGLDCITGLQTARILAARGVPVIGVAKDIGHFCCRTRVCERIIQADVGTPALIPILLGLASQLATRAVLYPCTDASVLVLSEQREELKASFYLALPDPDVVQMLMDKVRFVQFAGEHHIAIPQTFLLHDAADAQRAAKELTFPCVLKPPMKSARWLQHTKAKAFKVEDAEEFLALYTRCHEWADLLMAQQWVPGGEGNLFSCNCYYSTKGKPLATFVARKIRQWPPETGTSCLGEEVRNDEVLQETLALFNRVGYRGLGYVEIKRDEITGHHYIIEPNIGRPTGRSAIAEAGGVELLYTMYCDLTGLPLPPGTEQTYGGVKWIYWRNELRSAWHYWRKGEVTPAQVWQSWRGRKATAVFSWRDPMPFLADFGRSIWQVFRGAKGS